MKRSIPVAVALVVALAPFFAPAAGAQVPVTAVARVVDGQGNPIPDVQVLLDYKGPIPQKYRAKTDKNGVFTHVNVYAGLYRVTLKKEGVGETSFDYNVQELDRLAKPPDFKLAPKTVAAPPPPGSGLAPAAGAGAATPVDATKLAADINAAIALAHEGKVDAAIASYEAVLATAPGVPLVHYNLGAAYKKKGDLPKAEASLRKAVELDPGFVDGYVGLATLLAESGKPDEAIAAIQQGVAANGQSGRLQYALGVLAEGKGDTATAMQAFLKAEELDPQNVETQYHLATVALNMNDKAEAIARLEKFVATAPPGTPNLEVARSLIAALQKK
ncbi:MAG TPA: tetratricopeptide repeat protein [Vicinamibacteria bacterium]|nr:tetratricopeptide repeat protein [Vicinamibacteria bacterium]